MCGAGLFGGLGCGADDSMTKPFRKEELTALLAKVAEPRQERARQGEDGGPEQ